MTVEVPERRVIVNFFVYFVKIFCCGVLVDRLFWRKNPLFLIFLLYIMNIVKVASSSPFVIGDKNVNDFIVCLLRLLLFEVLNASLLFIAISNVISWCISNNV